MQLSNDRHFKHKLIISILFGVLGFVINFYTIRIVDTNGLLISVLPGLLFPLLISLTWGWKYGLISALFGGCQTMWLLWYSDGYGLIYSVPIVTLWVVFHGVFDEINKRRVEAKWYHNKYFVEILLRICIVIGYYTAFKYLNSMNPPFWDYRIQSNNITNSWLNILALKQIIEGFILLLLVDASVRFNALRKLLLLEKRSRLANHIIINSINVGIIAWFIDALARTYVLATRDSTFLDNLVLNVNPHDLPMRVVVIVILLIMGLLYSDATEKRINSSLELENQNNGIRDILTLTLSIGKAKNVDQEEFLLNLLATAVEIIPEADFGIVNIFEEGHRIPVIALGHNINDLRQCAKQFEKIKLEIDEDVFVVKGLKHNYLNKYYAEIKNKELELIKDDKETLVSELVLDGNKIASMFLGIDKDSDSSFSERSKELIGLISNIPSAFYTIIRNYELKQDKNQGIIIALTKILSLHNPYTDNHSTNVARISTVIARKLRMSDGEIDELYWSALVHDIGKILIPKEILDKQDTLTKEEYEVVKQHPVNGYKTLIASPNLFNIAKSVLHHHERWDGRGYPDGLSGESIPLISRIITVADTYDAMTSDRPYRRALIKEVAFQEIINNSGTQFDPKIVNAFDEAYRKEHSIVYDNTKIQNQEVFFKTI